MDPETRIVQAMYNYDSFDVNMQDIIRTMDAVYGTKSNPYVSILDGRLLWYFYPRENEVIPKPLGFEPTCRVPGPKDISEKPLLIGSTNHNKINWTLKEFKEDL